MSLRRYHIQVTGRVQGVGFRFFTQRAARNRRVSGWVRNRGDGSVEAEAQGTDAAVEAFLGDLREGPPMGFVREVKTWDESVVEGEKGFDIRF